MTRHPGPQLQLQQFTVTTSSHNIESRAIQSTASTSTSHSHNIKSQHQRGIANERFQRGTRMPTTRTQVPHSRQLHDHTTRLQPWSTVARQLDRVGDTSTGSAARITCTCRNRSLVVARALNAQLTEHGAFPLGASRRVRAVCSSLAIEASPRVHEARTARPGGATSRWKRRTKRSQTCFTGRRVVR